MTLLVVLLGVGFVLVPTTARAADDTVTNLSVDYDIQPDGSVSVRYEIDWRFASDGRHGIDFSIATRERWDADPTQDVVYDVTDIRVSSPSGAPDSFTQTDTDEDSVGSVDLRIGDPIETLDGTDATYVISYELRGALRTFDGVPEFFWDVTSADFPSTDQFSVTVKAPGGVQKARCLVGEEECGAEVVDGEAVLTGQDVAGGTIISAVAGLEPESVFGAEPTLEKRRIDAPTMIGMTSAVEVSDEGMTHVEQKLTYLLPDDRASTALHWSLPIRRPYSRDEDRVYLISNLAVEGAAEVEQRPLTDRDKSQVHQDRKIDVYYPEGTAGTVTLNLAYDVAGAVVAEGGTAHAQWLLAPVTLDNAEDVDAQWSLPADVSRAECLTWRSFSDEPGDCHLSSELEVSGSTVSWSRDGGVLRSLADVWIVADLPAASVGGVGPILEPGIEAGVRRDRAIGIGAGVGTLAGTAGLVMLLSRVRVRRDRRWADVAPGLTAPAGSPVRAVRRNDIVPVRFDEPDCSVALAGLVLDGRPSPRHLAAVLVHMAAQGAVTLQSKPLKVIKVNAKPLVGPLEKGLFKAATLSDVPLDDEELQQMGETVDGHQKTLLEDRQIFAAGDLGLPLYRNPVVWGLAMIVALWVFAPSALGSLALYVAAGAVGGSFVGLYLAARRGPRRTLEADGTALRDQVEGFRLYIEKAEANQLDFEADSDIYRRYLPWAVLFGLTKRWTEVCQQLAEASRIPELDTSFWIGADSAAAVAGDISLLHRPLRFVKPASASSSSSSSSSGFFSGGGSGGSSGFSGGSSGGGGGGGTSASSW